MHVNSLVYSSPSEVLEGKIITGLETKQPLPFYYHFISGSFHLAYACSLDLKLLLRIPSSWVVYFFSFSKKKCANVKGKSR